MKAFVTGGTGFIGSALVKRLIESGHEVTCLVRKTSNPSKLKALGATVVSGDIKIKTSMTDPISNCDEVFHLAAWYEFGIWNKRKMFETNVVGTLNVLDLALKSNKRVIYCSTAGTLGHSNGTPRKENSRRPDTFTSEYERTKYVAHMEARKFAANGLALVNVMPGAVFGPGDTSLVGQIVDQYVRGKLRFFIKTSPRFSWVHVDDVVEGFVLAEEEGVNGQDYILADRHETMHGFLRMCERISGVPFPKRLVGKWVVSFAAPFSELSSKIRGRRAILSREAARMLQRDWTWDSSKARTELGWEPAEFEKRVEDTVKWYVNRYSSP